MRDTLISVVCSELGFISPSTAVKAINMFMEYAVARGVRFTKTEVVTFATGKIIQPMKILVFVILLPRT